MIFTDIEEETGKFGSYIGDIKAFWDFSLPKKINSSIWHGYARRYINAYVPTFKCGDIFKEEKTLFEFVKESTTLDDIELRNILALLNFRGDDINKKIEVLSKGEKVKLYFVSLLFRKTDVLLLDEITNFLDVVAIEAVEKILKKYPGILIMVSHDMEFIDNVATKVINITNKEVLKFE